MTSDSNYWQQKHQEIAELEARYQTFNQVWRDAGIPVHVLETPDWKVGWQVLLDWLKPHYVRRFGLALWEDIATHMPKTKTAWAHEIHIFSHTVSPVQGHSLAHAVIEEEGLLAILAWWRERTTKS